MKNRSAVIIFLCTVFLLTASSLHAGSPVWKVSKNGKHLFLGGTIHVLAASDYPLPNVFEKCYYQSSIIVFETDAYRMQKPDFLQYTMLQLSNPEGTTLTSMLSPKTHKALDLYLQERGINIMQLESLKPGMVCITLTLVELSRLGLMGTGVDEYFTLRAINDSRDRLFLETPEEQVAFIAAMGIGREDQLIEYTLKDIKNLPQMMQELKTAWKNGNRKKLEALTILPIAKDFPRLYTDLVKKRNNAWMPKIKQMLTTPQVELVLVGAGHLVGKDGLLTKLEAAGYRVENQ